MAENSILFLEIRNEITDGNLKEALLKLNAWSDESESYLNDEIAQRLAHFNSNERSYNLGDISNSDYEIEKNKITKATLILLDEAKSSASVSSKLSHSSSASSSNGSRTTPKAYSTINDSASDSYQETPNAALAFIKKNMLWIGLAVVAIVVSIILIKYYNSETVPDPNSDSSGTYENKKVDSDTEKTDK